MHSVWPSDRGLHALVKHCFTPSSCATNCKKADLNCIPRSVTTSVGRPRLLIICSTAKVTGAVLACQEAHFHIRQLETIRCQNIADPLKICCWYNRHVLAARIAQSWNITKCTLHQKSPRTLYIHARRIRAMLGLLVIAVYIIHRLAWQDRTHIALCGCTRTEKLDRDVSVVIHLCWIHFEPFGILVRLQTTQMPWSACC